MKHLLSVLLVALCQQAGATNVSGILTGTTTFTKANSPYVVNGNLLVDEGATLVIEPGTEVRVDPNVSFFVDGSMKAKGTSADPIIFKSNVANNNWKGLQFRNAGTIDSGIFDHCNFSSANSAIGAGAGNFSITNCSVNRCTMGFYLDGPGSFTISGNVIKSCHKGIYGGTNGFISSNEMAHLDLAIDTWGNVAVLGNYIHDCWFGIHFNGAAGPNAEIANNKVVYCSELAYWINGTFAEGIHHNLSAYNRAVGYRPIFTTGNFEHNTSVNDSVGVLIIDGQNLVFKNNCITGSTHYAVKLGGSTDIDISGNYWGTTDTAMLNTLMYDYYDDFVSPKGQILPALAQADLSCQTYTGPPVTSVTTTRTETIAVTVSPNPFVNTFSINFQGKAATMEVFNMSGQRVMSVGANGKNKMEIDMSAYPAGVYHYRVLFSDRSVNTGKLVKQ